MARVHVRAALEKNDEARESSGDQKAIAGVISRIGCDSAIVVHAVQLTRLVVQTPSTVAALEQATEAVLVTTLPVIPSIAPGMAKRK